jgi:glycine/D-amino acid oxidase-like deaminating enzyme
MDGIFTDDFATDPWWWQAAPRREPERAQPLPAAIDVLVVGAGYTGLNCARITAAAGRETLVLDAQNPGAGASTRLAGYIGRFPHISFDGLEARHGSARAEAMWREAGDAHFAVLDLIEQEQMEVGKQYRGRYTAACTPAHYEELARKAEAVAKRVPFAFSLCPADRQRSEIGSDYWHGGLILEEHGTLHPGLYHDALSDAARRAGARIEGRTPVLDIVPEADGFSVRTRHHTIKARDVVICTNGYSSTQRNAAPWVRNRVVPIAAHQIVTEPLPEAVMNEILPNRRAMLDSRTNIIWCRPTPDDARLVFGARTGHDDGDLRITAQKLRSLMTHIFPQTGDARIARVWRGIMGFTFDHQPHIGQTPDGVWYATGFCGSGLPMSTWLGQKIGHRLLESPQGETAWWNPGFPTWPFYNGNPWWLPAYIAWVDLRDRLTTGPTTRRGA